MYLVITRHTGYMIISMSSFALVPRVPSTRYQNYFFYQKSSSSLATNRNHFLEFAMPLEHSPDPTTAGTKQPTSSSSLTAGQARWAHYTSGSQADVEVKEEDVFVSDDMDGFDTNNDEGIDDTVPMLPAKRPSGKYGDVDASRSGRSVRSSAVESTAASTLDVSVLSNDDDDDDDAIEEPPMDEECGPAGSLQDYLRSIISSIPEHEPCPSLPFSRRERDEDEHARIDDEYDAIVAAYSKESKQNTVPTETDSISVVTGHSTQTELVANTAASKGRRGNVSALSTLPDMTTTPIISEAATTTMSSLPAGAPPTPHRRNSAMLLPVDERGTAVTEKVLKAEWGLSGKCMECGQTQTHLKVKYGILKMFRKLEPQTIEGQVYKGYCLMCHDPVELRQLLNDDTIPLDLRRDEPSDGIPSPVRSALVQPDCTIRGTKTKRTSICRSWKAQICLVVTPIISLGIGIAVAINFSRGPQTFTPPPPTDAPSMAPTSLQWVLVGEIDGEGTETFGYSLRFNTNGTRIAVASPRAQGGNGQVDVYDFVTDGSSRSDNKFSTFGVRVGGSISGNTLDQMGVGMDISGDGNTLAIGYPGNGNGFVRVFRFVQNNWIQVGQTLGGPSVNSSFGSSVALNWNGSLLVVGAPEYSDANSSQVGYVQAYNFTGKAWEPFGQTLTSSFVQDRYGHAVAFDDSGLKLLVTAPDDDKKWQNGGQIYAYLYSADQQWTSYVHSGIFGEYSNSRFGLKLRCAGAGDSFVSAEPQSSSDGGVTSAGLVRVVAFDETGYASDTGFGVQGDSQGLELGIDVDIDYTGANMMASSRNINDKSGLVRIYGFSELGDWFQWANDIPGLPLGNESWLGFGPSVAMANWDRVAVGYESVTINGKSKSVVRFFEYMGVRTG